MSFQNKDWRLYLIRLFTRRDSIYQLWGIELRTSKARINWQVRQLNSLLRPESRARRCSLGAHCHENGQHSSFLIHQHQPIVRPLMVMMGLIVNAHQLAASDKSAPRSLGGWFKARGICSVTSTQAQTLDWSNKALIQQLLRILVHSSWFHHIRLKNRSKTICNC